MAGPADDKATKFKSPPGSPERLAERIAAGTQAEPPDPSGAEDDTPDEDPPEPVQQPKRNRWAEMKTERDQAKREAAEARDQVQRALLLVEESRRGQQQPAAAKPEAEDPAAPINSRLDQIDREQQLLMRELQVRGNGMSDDDLKKIQEQAQKLRREEGKLLARLDRLEDAPSQAQQQKQPNPLAFAIQAQLHAKYPELMQNKQAIEIAQAHYWLLRARGRQDGMAVVLEAYEHAKNELAGPQRKPDPNAAARTSGLSAGAGGSGDGDRRAHVGELSPHQVKMANSMYGYLPKEKDRIEKWKKGPGARAAAAAAKRTEA